MEQRRQGSDRRTRPTNPLSLSSMFGRRRQIRRREDLTTHRYVDVYSGRLVVIVLLSAALSVADTFFTLEIVSRGGIELNPIMDFFLRQGAMPFLAVKYFLTVSGLLILIVHQNFHLFGCGNCIRCVLMVQFFAWITLILWECYLLIGPTVEALIVPSH